MKKPKKKNDEIIENDVATADVPKPLGTAKAVETMFRNSIRAELDIIQLAATKANIMISLNGLIISALMISGAFIFNSSAAFLFPAGVFMFTAAASIIFALLAASPERADYLVGVGQWLRAMSRREASWRDLRAYLTRETPKEDLNLLIYEDRVQMSQEDHWKRMQELLRDRDDIYHKMTDQIYWLGLMADRKFRMLNISYKVFRWGLLLSIIAFISVKSAFGLFPGLSGEQVPRLRSLGISEFKNVYEPSAVQQLPDGRVLVVEDEASRSMSLMSFAADGTLVEDPALNMKVMRAFGRKLTDLEGLSIDDQGFVYAITSHSTNKAGKRRPDREQLLRFRIEGNHVGEISSVVNLRDMLSGDEALAAAIREKTGVAADFDKLNIEGLAYYNEAGHLLLGLREPLAGENSLIVPIRNPAAMFTRQEAPDFGPPIVLDLKGGGIRALSYDAVLGSFLIVNEIEGHDDNKYSQLWSWSGSPDAAPEPVALPDIINLNNVESIDSIVLDGEPRLLLMSDDGNEQKNRPARYMMLEYDQLTR